MRRSGLTLFHLCGAGALAALLVLGHSAPVSGAGSRVTYDKDRKDMIMGTQDEGMDMDRDPRTGDRATYVGQSPPQAGQQAAPTYMGPTLVYPEVNSPPKGHGRPPAVYNPGEEQPEVPTARPGGYPQRPAVRPDGYSQGADRPGGYPQRPVVRPDGYSQGAGRPGGYQQHPGGQGTGHPYESRPDRPPADAYHQALDRPDGTIPGYATRPPAVYRPGAEHPPVPSGGYGGGAPAWVYQPGRDK